MRRIRSQVDRQPSSYADDAPTFTADVRNVKAALEASLKELGTDYVDLLLFVLLAQCHTGALHLYSLAHVL